MYGMGSATSLAGTGFAVMGWVWFGIALVTIGGVMAALARFSPNRWAIEPVKVGEAKHRLRLTKNGAVFRFRRK